MNTKIKVEIIKEAQENPQEEICGILYSTLHEVKLFKCKNLSIDKAHNFEIAPEQYIECLKFGKPCGIYHSHPLASSAFSQSDLELADEMLLPIYVYSLIDNEFKNYVPKGYEVPLEGRPWIWGFADCYEQIRIYFRQKYNHYLTDYDRDESYMYSLDDRITKNIEKEGFERLQSLALIKKDDVLVFNNQRVAATPKHFAIFLGKSRMLHHPHGKLSGTELMTHKWNESLKYILRFKEL